MKVRFQADADLNQIILLATVRQEPSIDFQTALAAGLANLSFPSISQSLLLWGTLSSSGLQPRQAIG